MNVCRSFAVSCSLLACFLSISACTYVKPDSDSGNKSWYDGLNDRQIIEGMMMYAGEDPGSTEQTAVGIQKDIIVYWSIPLLVDSWAVSYNFTSADEEGLPVSATVTKISDEPDETGLYTYGFRCSVEFTEDNFIVFFRVKMTEGNESYENTVAYMLSPVDGTMNVSVAGVDAASISSLYLLDQSSFQINGDEEVVIDHITGTANNNTCVGNSAVVNVQKWSKVQLAILSDFSAWNGWSDDVIITHYSNTSYCHTSLNGGGESVTLSFEDLPISRLSLERDGVFDYNDVVFHVEFTESGSVE